MSRLWDRSRARIECLFHGHRGLSRAPAYGEVSSAVGGEKELHYCGECGGPAWISKPHRASGPQTWGSTGLTNP